jgi:hypothetical protein
MGNISGINGAHINLIHQSWIQRYLSKNTSFVPLLWFAIFVNNSLSPNLTNSVGSKIDELNYMFPTITLFYKKNYQMITVINLYCLTY